MTLNPEVSVGDIMSAGSFLVAAGGLVFAIYKLRKGLMQKRGEAMVEFMLKFITDEGTARMFYRIEYGQLNMGSDFLCSEDERNLDRLLWYFESIATLHEMGVLDKKDFNLVKYALLRVHHNPAIKLYYDHLDKHEKEGRISGCTFKTYRKMADMLEKQESRVL